MQRQPASRPSRLAAWLLAASALFAGASAAGAQQVGTGAAVTGNVFRNATPVSTGTGFFLNDQVLTEVASRLQILLLDQTTFTVGQSASIVIDRFVYDPDRGTGFVAAKVAKGAFRFMTGKRARGSAGQIDTPAATIGIRGTFLEGVVGPEAVDLARRAGLATSTCGNPSEALFVAMKGAGRSNSAGGNYSGRITVDTGAEAVTLSESNWSLFVSGRGCPISSIAYYGKGVRDVLDASLRSAPQAGATAPLAVDPLQPGILPPSAVLPRVNAPIFDLPRAVTEDFVDSPSEPPVTEEPETPGQDGPVVLETF